MCCDLEYSKVLWSVYASLAQGIMVEVFLYSHSFFEIIRSLSLMTLLHFT